MRYPSGDTRLDETGQAMVSQVEMDAWCRHPERTRTDDDR